MDTPPSLDPTEPPGDAPPGLRSRTTAISLSDVLLWAGFGLLLVAVGVGSLWFLRRRADIHALDPQPVEGDAAEAHVAGFCPEGLSPAPGGSCFALPPSAAGRRDGDAPVPLLVYLHGRYDPSTEAQELARTTRVAKMAAAKGYAVLAPQGTLGRCGDPQLAAFTCWPSNARTAEFARDVVTRWTPALASIQEKTGAGPRFLFGFSNGGYFASLIAEEGLAPFDAVVVAHAGPVDPWRASGKKIRMLLLTSDDDPSNDEMIRLDQLLGQSGWPHVTVGREGTHDLPEWDVEKALGFFARWQEPLPLSPPLALRGARPSATDAGLPAPPEPVPGNPDASPAEVEVASSEAARDPAPAATPPPVRTFGADPASESAGAE